MASRPIERKIMASSTSMSENPRSSRHRFGFCLYSVCLIAAPNGRGPRLKPLPDPLRGARTCIAPGKLPGGPHGNPIVLSDAVFQIDGLRGPPAAGGVGSGSGEDRKSTRLNSSHGYISYAVFCLKKKKNIIII